MNLEDIPRRQEALIVAEAQQRIDRLIIAEHFDRRVASFSEVSHVARAVWIGALRGTPMSAEKIAHTIGMPRATVLRKSTTSSNRDTFAKKAFFTTSQIKSSPRGRPRWIARSQSSLRRPTHCEPYEPVLSLLTKVLLKALFKSLSDS